MGCNRKLFGHWICPLSAVIGWGFLKLILLYAICACDRQATYKFGEITRNIGSQIVVC